MTLEAPIKRVADRPLDEVAVARIWRAVANARGRERAGSPKLALGLVASIAAAVALVLLLVSSPGRHDAGPLRLRGGPELATLPVDAVGEPSSVQLEDGSYIALAPHAKLVTLVNTSTSVVALLATGRATFDVRPGGPRRWSIECGLATVEVVGTRFTIERSLKRLRVEVERGVVLVRGELVKDRVARLSAGESLEVEDGSTEAQDTRAVDTQAPPPPSPAPVAPAPSGVAQGAASPSDEPAHRWRPLAEKGNFREAYDALTPEGLTRQARGASVDDLLLLADVARLSGHPGEAVAPLTQVIREHRGPQASVAAFTLGRIRLDALGQAGLAAQSFAEAIALGLPEGLQEDAYARLVEARARAGDATGARSAADDYAVRYPAGRRLAEVRGWAERK